MSHYNRYIYRWLLGVLVCAGALTGCTDDLEDNYYSGIVPVPAMSVRELSFSVDIYQTSYAKGEGDNLFYQVRSLNSPWALTAAADWLNFTVPSGDGTQEYTSGYITVSPNYEEDGRTTTYTLSSTDDNWPYTSDYYLYQYRASDFLTVSTLPGQEVGATPYLEFDSKGGVATVAAQTNLSAVYWRFPEWITIDYAFSNHKLTLTVTASENGQSEDRSGSIIFYSDESGYNQLAIINVYQHSGIITASTDTLAFGNKGGQANIALTTDLSWTVNADYSGWLNVSPASGTGNGTVTISATENESTETRIGYVYVQTGGNNRIEIPVSQSGIYLNVDSTDYSVAAAGRNLVLTISSNTSWEISGQNDYDWIDVSNASGEGDKKVTIKVSNNNSTDTRYAALTVERPGLGLYHKVMITQYGKVVNVGENTLSFDAVASNKNVPVTSDGDWVATVDENCRDWVKVRLASGSGSGSSSVSGKGNASLRVSVTANDTENNRTGYVRVAIGDGTPAVLTVYQRGRYFTIDNPRAEFSATGGKQKIYFESNTKWSAKLLGNGSSWIEFSKKEGTSSGADSITVTAKANPSINTRRDTLEITPQVGQTLRVILTQAARTLTVNTAAIRFFASGGTSDVVTVQAIGNFNVTKGADDTWFTISKNNNTFTVKAEANENEERREGVVTVSLTDLPSGESYSINIPVTQYGASDTNVLEGFGNDENWSLGGTSTVTISVVGFSSDQNWNVGGTSTLSISVTGFGSDSDWTIGGN